MTDVKELIERIDAERDYLSGCIGEAIYNGEDAVNDLDEVLLGSSLALTHLSEQNAKRIELDEAHKDTRGDFHSVYDELRASRNFLASEGYRRCDIAACNCLSWHDHGPQGYNGLRQKIEDLEEQNAAKDKEIAELRGRYAPDPVKKDWCLCGSGVKSDGVKRENPHTLHCQAYYKPNQPDLIRPFQTPPLSEGKT